MCITIHLKGIIFLSDDGSTFGTKRTIRYRPLNPGRYATGEKTSMKFQLDSRNYTANKYGQFADMNT